MADMQPNWTGKLISLAVDSPLHFGERASGNLRQTRRYVPGRTIWGAITNRLTRLRGWIEPARFEETGETVHRALRFSYGFLSTSKNVVTSWPWEHRERFDWMYVQSYSSTALQDGRSKEDGSLHETEFLAPKTRDRKPTYVLMYVWKNEASFPPELADPLTEQFWDGMAIGGEQGYGWGRLRPAIPFQTATGSLFDVWTATPELNVRASGEARTLSHVSWRAGSIDGPVEALVGRETKTKDEDGRYLDTPRPGGQLSSQLVAYSPGSRVGKDRTFSIGRYGVWT